MTLRLYTIALGVPFLLAACSGSTTSPPDPAETAAATPVAPASRLPGARAQSIAVPAGRTAVTYSGTLAADTDAEFVIGEERGTLMLVSVNAANGDPKIAVYRADTGANLPDEHPNNVAHWIERLPASIGYLIVVEKTGTSTPFTLDVEVPRHVIFDDKQRSEMSFAAPAHSVTTLIVPPSQSVTAELVSAPADAFLTLNTLDDGRKMLSAEAGKQSFTGAPGRTDDEIVVRVHQGANDGDLRLRAQRQ